MIIMETGRLILRDLIPEDIAVRRHFETEDTEWQLWDAPWECEGLDAEEQAEALDDCMRALEAHVKRVSLYDADHIRHSFQIVEKETGRYLGWVNAYDIDDEYTYTPEDGRLTIGIDLPDRSARGRGYGTEALSAVIGYYSARGYDEVYTQTWSGNRRMIRLAEKLGFREVCRKKDLRCVRGASYDGLTFRMDSRGMERHRGSRTPGA